MLWDPKSCLGGNFISRSVTRWLNPKPVGDRIGPREAAQNQCLMREAFAWGQQTDDGELIQAHAFNRGLDERFMITEKGEVDDLLYNRCSLCMMEHRSMLYPVVRYR